MGIQITCPPGGSNVNIVPNKPFSVCGTSDDDNSVAGTLYDERSGITYYPIDSTFSAPKDKSSYGSWILTFNIADTIPAGDYLDISACDTGTGEFEFATYKEDPTGSSGCNNREHALVSSSSLVVKVSDFSITDRVFGPHFPPKGTHDIPITIKHPENAKGIVSLFLWKKHTPDSHSSTIVQSHPLSSSVQTKCMFPNIDFDYWDLICVHVIVRGGEAHPIVLKAAKKPKK